MIIAVATLLAGAGTLLFAAGGGPVTVAAATGPAGNSSSPFDIVVQTMDSCKTPQNGAHFELLDSAGGPTNIQATTYPAGTGSLSAGTCPLEQGNCATVSKGCLAFHSVPPGDYRLRQTATPAGNPTNPAGYAPCNGGSACRWQTADVTVNPDGSVAAEVTNEAPNGQVTHFPNDPNHAKYFAGTTADPIAFHDFGLAPPGFVLPSGLISQPCDGPTGAHPDTSPPDADDWSTGTPSGQCALTPSDEGTCTSPTAFTLMPGWALGGYFPWQCESNPVTTPAHLISIVLNMSNQAPGAFEPFTVTLSNGGTAQTLTSAYLDANGVSHAETVMSVSGGPNSFTVQLGHPGTQTIKAMNGTTTVAVGEVVVSPGNGSFVANLYHDVLGRSGDLGGIEYWTNRLDTGAAVRADVARAFVVSTEAHGFIVDADYELMLGRSPEQAGYNYWVSQLNAGAYNESLLGLIGGSPEFYNSPIRGQGNDTAFVNALYQVLLNRTPLASEVAWWVNAIATGTPRSAMGDNFSFSHEFHMGVVAGWYTHYLQRPPDAAGQLYWAGNLDKGQSDDVGAVNFLSSDEYYGESARY